MRRTGAEYLMAKKQNYTATVNGWRWETTDQKWPTVVYLAKAARRCTTDSGRAYFRRSGPSAEFDTAEMRTQFMAAFDPQAWGEETPTARLYQQTVPTRWPSNY